MLTLICSCTYSDSGIFFVTPVPGDPPEIWVTTNLDSIPNPTVVDSLEVIYDVEIINGDFYQLEAYFLNELVFNSDSTNGSFWIDSTFVQSPEVDTLSLYFFFSTNSNSLANIVGLEYDYVSLDFPINYEQGGTK